MILKNIKETTAFTAGDQTIIREVLHPRHIGGPLAYSLAHATLEAGQSSLPHVLGTSSEVYVILQGRGRVTIEGESRDVGVGDVVFIPGGARQHITNKGGEALEFLCIVSPPWRESDESVEG